MSRSMTKGMAMNVNMIGTVNTTAKVTLTTIWRDATTQLHTLLYHAISTSTFTSIPVEPSKRLNALPPTLPTTLTHLQDINPNLYRLLCAHTASDALHILDEQINTNWTHGRQAQTNDANKDGNQDQDQNQNQGEKEDLDHALPLRMLLCTSKSMHAVIDILTDLENINRNINPDQSGTNLDGSLKLDLVDHFRNLATRRIKFRFQDASERFSWDWDMVLVQLLASGFAMFVEGVVYDNHANGERRDTGDVQEVRNKVEALRELGFDASVNHALTNMLVQKVKEKVKLLTNDDEAQENDRELVFLEQVGNKGENGTAWEAMKSMRDTSAMKKIVQYLIVFCVPYINVMLNSNITTSYCIRNSNNQQMDIGKTKEKEQYELSSLLLICGAQSLAQTRINSLFDLIVDYPASLNAIMDLKDALAMTDVTSTTTLITSLKDALNKRLLQAGAMTTDIIYQFVNMMKTLAVIDPSGDLAQVISLPLRNYLRTRNDTIRCIMSQLSEEGDLSQELLQHGLIKDDHVFDHEDSIEDIHESKPAPTSRDLGYDPRRLNPLRNWAPRPLYIMATGGGSSGQWDLVQMLQGKQLSTTNPTPLPPVQPPTNPDTANPPQFLDILSTFVSIYGSRDVFVKEYKSMLSDKLLGLLGHDIQRETRTLELLKSRFGDASMHECSIMLRDISETRRLLNSLRNSLNKADPASVTLMNPVSVGAKELLARDLEFAVTSYVYWPSSVKSSGLKQDMDKKIMSLLALGGLSEAAEIFQRHFETIKTPRKLKWKAMLGTISLSLSFEDGRQVHVKASPLAVAVLNQFTSNDQESSTAHLSMQQLVDRLEWKDDMSTLRATLRFWMQYEVLKRTKTSGVDTASLSEEIYEVIEYLDKGEQDDVDLEPAGMQDALPAASAARNAGSEEMKVYESYVYGMLQNFDALPADRIHNMLKLFVVTPSYDKTLKQLSAFLDELVLNEKLKCANGLYSVK